MEDNIHAAKVDLYCKELRLPGLRRSYAPLAREAVDNVYSPTRFLAACLEEERISRQQSRLQTYTRQARFPVTKTLQEFDFTAIPSLSKHKALNLAQGSFVGDKENVVFMGGSGTGKSHLGIAIGQCAIAAGYRVRFISVMQLAQELLQAESEYRLPRYLKTWDKFDLVIADELGYVSLAQGGTLLFQFCAHRYEQGSLLITTNLEFGRWDEVFHNATMTTALLDRLTHHAHILLFEGDSYRFRESQRRSIADRGFAQ